MSSTRRAAQGSPLRQNRYASDPMFVEQRGVNGTAVANRAQLLFRSERELVHFIRSLSLTPDPLRPEMPEDNKPRGIRRVVAELLEMFPERLGCPAMREYGAKPGQKYSSSQSFEILDQLGLTNYDTSRRWGIGGPHALDEKPYTADVFRNHCRQRALEEFPNLLTRLCVDPHLRPELVGEQAGMNRENVLSCILDNDAVADSDEIEDLIVPYFQGLTSALFEYQRRYAERLRRDFVMTTIARPVFTALDYALKERKMILIRGKSGIGKSESNKTWAEMHRGQALWVSMKGINNRTGFFRTLAKSCGVACTPGLSPAKVQARVEDFIERTHMMLVIDEAQYLWPQQKRIESQPELVNWLMTSCFNQGIPVAMIATKEFDRRRRAVEQQTDWSSEQLSRRIKRAIELPDSPTLDDLEAVARKRLPESSAPMIKLIVGYAMTSGRFMDGVGEVIEDARWLCSEEGRERVAFDDLKRAISELRAPSDASLKRALKDDAPKPQRSRRAPAAALQDSEGEAELTPTNLPDRAGLGASRLRHTAGALAVG